MKVTNAIFFILFSTVIGILSCKKKSSPPFPLNYTSKMGGIRHWSGVILRPILDTSGGTVTLHIDSTYISDTFAVVIINDKTIQTPNLMNDPDFGFLY